MTLSLVSIGALFGFGALALILWPLLRPQRGAAAHERSAHEIAALKSGLADAERDLAAGAIAEHEAESMRLEISRRLLAADKAAQGDASLLTAPRAVSVPIAMAAGLLLLIGALALYGAIGQASFADRPYAERNPQEERALKPLGQSEAVRALYAAAPNAAPSGQEAELLNRLTTDEALAAAQTPALNELASGLERRGAAARATPFLRELVRRAGDNVEPRLLYRLGVAMTQEAGGYVSKDAETLFERARKGQPAATRYLIAASMQRGDAAGFRRAFSLAAEVYESGSPRARAGVWPILYELATYLGVTPETVALRGGGAVRWIIDGKLARDLAIALEKPEDLRRWDHLIRANRAVGRAEIAAALNSLALGRVADRRSAAAVLRRALTEPIAPGARP